LLLERAVELVQQLLPPPERADWLRGLELLARAGYTAAHAMADGPAEALHWAEALARDEALPLRLYWAIRPEELDQVEPGWRGSQLDVAAVKLFADGALGSQTAWMREPYADGRTGIVADSPARIRAIGERAAKAGFTLAVHAIGDQAVASVVRVFRELGPMAPAPLRVEHAQHLAEETLKLLVEPIAVSLQPLHLPGDVPLIHKLLPGRQGDAYRFADLAATGLPMAFGSDAPVVPPDAAGAIQVATSHPLSPNQSLTEEQAIEAFTRGAARAAGWSDSGTIAASRRADLTLWEQGRPVARVFEGRLEPCADAAQLGSS
jgi:predicted amidohydrolase YtcJ